MLKIAWQPCYKLSLPKGHRFPMEKYELIPEQLIYEGTASLENFFAPEPLAESFILETHCPIYWQKLKTGTLTPREVRKTGFPMSPELIQREITILDGTIKTALFALEFGISMNVAGGTHHAFTNRGEGFCLLNDIAVSANFLLNHHAFSRILVVDLDVHQGNGTAQIFENEPRVFTFSMHGEKNYPLQKEKSDLDIPLIDGTNESHYLPILERHLLRVLEDFQPEFIFFQAGVDVLVTDKLGRLGLSLEGCKARDRFVLETCHKNKIPVSVTMGGGYSPKISTIIEAHSNTFRLAQEIFF